MTPGFYKDRGDTSQQSSTAENRWCHANGTTPQTNYLIYTLPPVKKLKKGEVVQSDPSGM
jgi:hypothetical protein